jgi:hypothetical protein
MTHVARHDADVAGLEVEGARGAFAGEDGDAGAAFDEEGPFVGVCWEELDCVNWLRMDGTYDANAFRGSRQAEC